MNSFSNGVRNFALIVMFLPNSEEKRSEFLHLDAVLCNKESEIETP